MNKEHLALAGQMREELSELQQVVGRVEVGWERAKKTSDDFYPGSYGGVVGGRSQ